MPPGIVDLRIESDMDERPPAGTLRLVNQPHANLVRQAISFPCITGDARTDDIFPSREASFIPRNHVIEIEVLLIKVLPAILAGVLIALEDVVPGELHFFPRHAIEQHQHDHPWDADFQGNGVDHVLLGRLLGEVAPRIEIVREEIGAIRIDDLGVTRAEKRKRPPDRADIDGLPEAVQDEDLSVEKHN